MVGNARQIEQGHEEPFAVQFSVFLPNRVGMLRDLLDLLHGEGVDLCGLSIVDASEWAVIRAVCRQPGKARAVLDEMGVGFTERDVLLPVLCETEALGELCAILLHAELSIQFAYPLMIRSEQCPVMVLCTDDNTLARSLLTRHGLTLLGAEDLEDPS